MEKKKVDLKKDKKLNSLVVFTPKYPELYKNRRRFLVTRNTLEKYVTSQNANKCLLYAMSCDKDKCTVNLRNYGRVEIYYK
jgi:hypothetical protein